MSTAAAQVACQCIFDLAIIGPGIGFKQSGRAHDHAADAVAALSGLLINKCLLQLAWFVGRAQAFEGCYGFSGQCADGQQARARRHAVYMHGASTALA